MDGVNSSGELLRLREDRGLGLHPEEIAVGSESDGTVDGALRSALVAVVALAGSGRVPVPEDGDAEDRLGELDGVVVRGVGGLGGVLVDLGLGDVLLGGSGGDGDRVEREPSGLGPLVLDRLELVSRLPGALSSVHGVDEVTDGLVGGAEDEGVVALVDVARDERCGLGVRASDGEVLDAHDIVLEADGDEAVDVLRDGNEDLSGHVSALLCPRRLVLDVDSGGTLLDEHLRELHDGGETSVSGVGIGDDGAEVVDVGGFGALGGGEVGASLALLAVVEKLGHEEVLDLAQFRVKKLHSGEEKDKELTLLGTVLEG